MLKFLRFWLDSGEFVDFVVGFSGKQFWVRQVLPGIGWRACDDCPIEDIEAWSFLCSLFIPDDKEVVGVKEISLDDLIDDVISVEEVVHDAVD